MKWIKRTIAAVLSVAALVVLALWTVAPKWVEGASNPVRDHAPYPVSDAARALHRTLTVGDLHADPLLWSRDLSLRGTRGQVDVPRLIEGNVALQVFTAVTKSPAGLNYEENSAEAFDMITPLAFAQRWPVVAWGSLLARAEHQAHKLHDVAAASNGQLRIIKSRADLDALLADRAAGMRVVGGILGIEGAHPLEGEIANLDRIVAAGHRVVALHHFFDNELGGSLHGTSNAGLTDFGRTVVQEVVARGLILDLAHSSKQVVEDVLALTDIPLILSHTGVQAHCDVTRNLPDPLMKRVVASGGIIGMGYWDEVNCGDSTPRGVARSIKTAVDLLGVDHVALGSDFDGSVGTDFDTSELSALTHALLQVGLTEPQIRKVMGENMMRVLRARLP